jgi:hypothetical protein
LIGRGERVLRVPTKLMADARRGGSKRGKSDRIDAIAVARAGLRERLDELPLAQLDGRELDLRLLVDHRQRLVGQRVRIQKHAAVAPARPQTRTHAPGGALFSVKWSTRITRRLARTEQICASGSPATSSGVCAN